jgi:hypothetical protein
VRSGAYSFDYTTPAGNQMRICRTAEATGKRMTCRASIEQVDHVIPERVSELLWLRIVLFPERVVMDRRQAEREQATQQEELARYRRGLIESLSELREE